MAAAAVSDGVYAFAFAAAAAAVAAVFAAA